MSYLTEEQQIETLKEWWKDNGTPLVVGAILGLGGFAGWKFWNEQKENTYTQASIAYEKVKDAIEKKEQGKLVESAEAVKKQFPDSNYAVLASFHIAKKAVEDNDLEKAAQEFNWVVKNHGTSELAQVAKIRLARIYIAQNKADQALPLLAFDNTSGYFEMASLVKGDAYSALGKNDEALEAYNAAKTAGKVTAGLPSLALKIDELSASQLDLDDLDTNTSTNTATPESESDSNKASEKNETPAEKEEVSE